MENILAMPFPRSILGRVTTARYTKTGVTEHLPISGEKQGGDGAEGRRRPLESQVQEEESLSTFLSLKTSLLLARASGFLAGPYPQNRSVLKRSVVNSGEGLRHREESLRKILQKQGCDSRWSRIRSRANSPWRRQKASPFSRKSPEMRAFTIPTNESKPLGNLARKGSIFEAFNG